MGKRKKRNEEQNTIHGMYDGWELADVPDVRFQKVMKFGTWSKKLFDRDKYVFRVLVPYGCRDVKYDFSEKEAIIEACGKRVVVKLRGFDSYDTAVIL